MVISPTALDVLLQGKNEGQMVYVRAKDNLGFLFEGRVLEADSGLFDIQATDGETVWHVKVSGIEYVDVRPFRRFDGRGTAQFVADFGPGVS